MHVLKNLIGTLCVLLLPLFLFTFGVLVSLYHTLGSPTPIKDALQESGLYDVAIGEALATSARDAGSSATGSLPIDNPEVQAAIKEAIPPRELQVKSEAALDGIFDWVQGKSSELAFSVDLEDTKTRLADNLAAYTTRHLSTLPVCDQPDTTAITNPLNATCVPAGLDVAASAEQVRTEILSNDDFLPGNSLTADDLKNDAGESVGEQLSALPAAYVQVRTGVIITGAAVILLIAGTIFGAPHWKRGARRAAVSLLTVGVVSAGAAWIGGIALDRFSDSTAGDTGAGALQGSLLKAAELLTADLRAWWLGYGIILTILGISILIILAVLKRRGREVAPLPIDPRPEDHTLPPSQASETPASPASVNVKETQQTQHIPRLKK